ncbi:MAG: hypothetical protein A2987_02955 [Omnitrophica bacterium RIFCSPLOWO2_01_FULL_45_10]|nr:MAG: hypothetical protein A2987_02955 [Omnitrophica bacterium RIFCSPLOWO2_01_FULL_45_10]
MKRFKKIFLLIISAAVIYSLVPVVTLYFMKEPAPYMNEKTAEKLSHNKGDYFGFIVFGDCHSGFMFNDSATLKLIRQIDREDRFKKLPIDFVVVAGDATFRGSEWEHRIYNKTRSLIKWPILTAMGNHDDDDDKGETTKYFKKYIGAKELSFANRGSYFIIIDNAAGDISEECFSAIEEELKKSLAYKHRFIIAHKSPMSPYQQSWYRPELSPWSYRFMKLCERYKVDIVFCGHEHMFKESVFGGVKYITSGGGGMITQIPKRDGGFLHYLVVRVYGDYVDYEARKVSPPLWEYLIYYMWKDAFYLIKDAIF